MTGGIYKITNTTNGKFYIGSAVLLCLSARRRKRHFTDLRCGVHSNRVIQRSWNKYGEAAFKFKPIITCAPKDLIFYEQRCLDILKPQLNLAPVAGSNLGVKRTAEDNARASAIRIGKPLGPHSDATKQKISDNTRGKPKPNYPKVRNSPACSAEKKAKISAAQIGIPKPKPSAEVRAKLSAIQKARRLAERGGLPIMKPEPKRKKLFTHDGISLTMYGWADRLGVSYDNIKSRIRMYGIDVAVTILPGERHKRTEETKQKQRDARKAYLENRSPEQAVRDKAQILAALEKRWGRENE